MRVFEGVSLGIARGEVVDVVGPSGSGKTTLLRAFARLVPAYSGELHLEGVSAREISPQQWRCRVALLPQKPAITPGTIRDNLLLPWSMKARAEMPVPADEQLSAQLERIGLGMLVLDRPAARLSVGQQARLALLRVLLTSPSVLLLDEADASLDAESAAAVTTMTRHFAEEGGAAIRVRHREDDAVASRRFVMRAGTLEELT